MGYKTGGESFVYENGDFKRLVNPQKYSVADIVYAVISEFNFDYQRRIKIL